MRGYDKKEVDEFLDDVIKDYESYISQLQELRAENEKLKQELAAKPKAAPATLMLLHRLSTHVLLKLQQTSIFWNVLVVWKRSFW